MLLPRTEPVFDGLRTSFLRFDGLLSELRADGHSGFVTVEFPGYLGAILLDGGSAIAAVEEVDGQETHGAAALRGIVTRACEPGGEAGVFRLPGEFVRLAATAGSGDAVYRDLSSSFTSLERLLAKFGEDHFDGYVQAEFAASSASGLVFLRGGATGDALFAVGDVFETGDDAVAAIVGGAEREEAIYHVFHTTPGTGTLSLADARGSLASDAPPASAKEPAAPPVTSGPLAVWSEIFRRAEEVVDGLSQKGTFAAALHEAFTERASRYAYLDPTVAEFSYQNGQATFHGEVPESLPDALTDCLHDAIARLAFRLKRSDIESRVRAELSEIRSRHTAAVQGFSASARALVS